MRLKGYIGLTIVCFIYWVLDSIWSYLSFEYNLKNLIISEPASYIDTFLLRVPPYQMISRLMVVTLFTIFGSIILEILIKKQVSEKERKEAHGTLLTVLNSIDATIYVADMQTYEILFMNKYIIDHFDGNHTGKICHEVFRNNTEVCDNCTNDQLLNSSGDPKEVVVWEGRNPVTGAWFINYDRAIRWIDGRIVHLQIATDITKIKELQKRQQRAEARLLQSQKMESVGVLAGGIAHDFNNILFMISGNVELAIQDIPEGIPARANLKEIKAACLRATGIIKQLLNFSRKSGHEFKPTDFIAVIKDALYFLRSTIPSNIEIRENILTDELTILSDPVQIYQVLMNILTNSSQAMEQTGGTLEITIDRKKLNVNSTEEILDSTENNYAKITISDTGPGIDPEIIDQIFDPYFTTKEVGKGSGMGLAVVHGIVEDHGGIISVDSQLKKGTTFTALFPMISGKPMAEVKKHDEMPHGNERILFVDDEETIVDMMGEMLERLGYIMETKKNPIEALKLFQSKPYAFDLVITDMTMPKMTGIQLSEGLKDIRPDIPVIISTGYNTLIDDERAKLLGIAAYVTKPFKLKDIAKIIRNVLDEDRRNT